MISQANILCGSPCGKGRQHVSGLWSHLKMFPWNKSLSTTEFFCFCQKGYNVYSEIGHWSLAISNFFRKRVKKSYTHKYGTQFEFSNSRLWKPIRAGLHWFIEHLVICFPGGGEHASQHSSKCSIVQLSDIWRWYWWWWWRGKASKAFFCIIPYDVDLITIISKRKIWEEGDVSVDFHQNRYYPHLDHHHHHQLKMYEFVNMYVRRGMYPRNFVSRCWIPCRQ